MTVPLHPFDLSEDTIIVVGSASGLGRASALGLARAGAEVICADLNLDGAEETARQIRAEGARASARLLDITDTEATEALADELPLASGLVITPGFNARKRLLDTTDADFDRVIEINLKGTYRLMRAFGRTMAARGGGSIVAFASFRAEVVEPGQGIYAAAKAGVVQLVKTMASELGTAGVRVNAVLPGPFATPLTEQIKADAQWWDAYADKTCLGRWAQPEEISGAVVFLASRGATYVTGTTIHVDGGWTAHDGRFQPRLG